MYKYKVSGVVEVDYIIQFDLYEKLYNLYNEYPYLQGAMKTMMSVLNEEYGYIEHSAEFKGRIETFLRHCSMSDVSSTFPSNYVARTIHITDYEIESTIEDLKEFEQSAMSMISNMLNELISMPHCKLENLKVYITNIEDITEN